MRSLQPMIEPIYSDRRYGRTLDYTRPLDPPLSAEDRQFAEQQINNGG
jgi:hypothetical protein